MHPKGMETVCGLDCGDCAYVKEGCSGCNAEKGAPFWCGFAGVSVCPVYDCCGLQQAARRSAFTALHIVFRSNQPAAGLLRQR
jgi:hypothetical protein